ncbi:interactor of constitutive active ROPs 5-like [Nicotiana tomentosiformis]|uniref:interactor of constitutive active ROPs 5-like n=1 Tax=Nicotiana tomentosiformis TaxID=4098 RepID=UPI00388CACD4
MTYKVAVPSVQLTEAFNACVTKDAILRPSGGEEGTKSLVLKPGKDRKRKTASQSEDPKPKTRRVKKKEEVIKDLQADLAKAREEEAELDKQVSIVILEYGFDPTMEANPPLSQLQQKVEKIGLLRGEVDQIKAECDRWKATMDNLAVEKETILAKLLSADVQLRGVKQKSLSQARRIEELETGLVEAKAEIESSKVMADKSIAVYRADPEAAQMQLREASDREQRVTDLAKCQSRRETLKKIHTRDFELFEEIARAKELEAEARQLVSFDDDDNYEEGSRAGPMKSLKKKQLPKEILTPAAVRT